jgi:predicted nucleic acid-binding protein
MLMVDSSVWIDYFRDRSTRQTDFLEANWSKLLFAVGDLVLAEVLQGCDTDREFAETREFLLTLEQIEIAGSAVAQKAAQNYRSLRGKGITIRKTIDTLIATRCIVDGHHLLYSDKDFDPFVTHLGLISAIAPAH